jgi:hypothetical protein
VSAPPVIADDGRPAPADHRPALIDVADGRGSVEGGTSQ